jgi:hypothetical protein
MLSGAHTEFGIFIAMLSAITVNVVRLSVVAPSIYLLLQTMTKRTIADVIGVAIPSPMRQLSSQFNDILSGTEAQG